MQNKQQRLKENRSQFQEAYSKNAIIKGSIIATIIAITPYLFSIHLSVPKTQVWDTLFFTYDSKSWQNANLVMWIFSGKSIPLLLILIWFFTNRHWWYHTLLVPIAMYIYQIFDLFFQDQELDKFQLIYMVPIMAIVIPSIYLIRAKILNSISQANKSMEELEEELKLRPKNFWGKVKDYF
ncbi:hypothetical protein LG651_09745 [Tamlana sp. 62-3]|uniref:Uncharacterized protein n=1 Tax=Neotamlana sargassicola TaxID=2883125 RepID=A0A9X1L768_9FLAO|nr:hypothetical protein [Tamlana sargassicola]MCB4808536.1 hypothetical protein [Tamlana sargassicola]